MIALNNIVIIKPIEKEVKEEVFVSAVNVNVQNLCLGEVVSVANGFGMSAGDKVLYTIYGAEQWDDLVLVTADMVYAKIN